MQYKNINIKRILIVVAFILLIPLFGNIFVDGWNWGPRDFVFAAGMFFVAGLGLELVFKKWKSTIYRIIMSALIVLVFVIIWTELAVDAVSRLIVYILE